MNKRRKLIVALGAGALAAPFASFAQQQGKVWRVGFLSTRSRPASLDTDYVGAFPRAMRELGYIEGKNLVIEWRFADNNVEQFSVLAAELLQLKVDISVTNGIGAVSAAQKATTTIPIIFGASGDPVAAGFVKSLARPGGNMTGLSNLSREITPKHLEMLITMVPNLSRVAVLLNPANFTNIDNLQRVQSAAQKTGVKILPVEARTAPEIEKAFAAMARDKAGAVIVIQDVFLVQQSAQIVGLAAKHRLPSVSLLREYAEAGGLMSYGADLADNFRRAATYVDKIFKGAKAGDLPVQLPTKFELVINSKTAKALGLTIPKSLLLSADKVIE